MSGLEIIGFLLGTTGPIEQGIRIVQWLQTHVHNFKQNSDTIKDLNTLYSQNHEQLKQVQLQIKKCQPHLSQQALDAFNKIISQVKEDIQAALDSLQKRKQIAEKKGLHHFFKATNIASTCDDVMQLLNNAKESLGEVNHPIAGIEANMSITDAQTKELEKHFIILLEEKIDPHIIKQNAQTDDIFKAGFQRQHYTHAAKPNFQTDQHSNPISTEAWIKQELLSAQGARQAIIAIQGEAGVGKTTTLNMLSTEPEIRAHFEHGVYYISLGADASTDTVTQQLREIVCRSGGIRIAADRENWTNITRALDEASQWFKDKTFLLLIDDVWDTAGIGKILQDIISQIILTSPNAGAVLTTRNQTIATTETTRKVFHLKRKDPISRESREMLMRHARYPEDSVFDINSEEALKKILERTAGLPVAHSVAGKAVAQYALGSRTALSPWVWFLNTNESILRLSCENYPSLYVIFSTAIRTVEVKNKNHTSPSSQKSTFTTEDYMKMHRSLCVFEKQEWILISVLVRLWGLDQTVVRGICEEFVKVGLADRRDELSKDGSTVQGIVIHDLLHDFATEEANRHETVEKWHDQLVTRYSEEAGLSANEKCYSWWKLEDVDNGYLMKNLSRHLLGSKSGERNMKHVVSRPEWIASQLESNGIVQYEKDIFLAMKQQEDVTGGDSELMNNATLGDILSAAKLSLSFILNNRREVWFQLYARLMDADESCFMKRYLQEIEEIAPRPWVKPLSKCLTTVRDGTKQQCIYVKEKISRMAVIPDKRDIVCGSGDGSITVVDTEKSKVKRTWKAHKGRVTAICISPGGRFIVSGSRGSTVKLWDCESCEQIGKTFSVCSELIRSVAVSRDERTVYIGSRDGSVRSWDVDTCTQKTILFQGAPFSVGQLCVLANEDIIFSCKRSSFHAAERVLLNVGKYINDEGLKRFLPQRGPTTEKRKGSFVQSGEKIVLLEVSKDRRDKGLMRFLPRRGPTTLKRKGSFVLSGDGTTLVLFNYFDTKVIIWNAMDMKKEIATISLPGFDMVCSVAVNSNGNRIAIRHLDSVHVFEQSKNVTKEMYQSLGTYNFESTYIRDVYFLGIGDKLALRHLSTTSVMTRQVLDSENQLLEEEPQTQKTSFVRTMTKSPEGDFFATGHFDGKIRFWEARSGKQMGDSVFVAMARVDEIAFSADAGWMAARSDDIVTVRNVRSGEMKRIKLIQRKGPKTLAINCDGTLVVVQHITGKIELWDTSKSNKPLLVIPEDERKHITRWEWVWFRKESHHIVAVSLDETWIEEWDISSGCCVQSRERPCPWSRRTMSRDVAFNMLDNPENQRHDLDDAPRMFRSGNEIRYRNENSVHTVATLESRASKLFYAVKSNAVGVLLGNDDVYFFHLYS